MRVFVTGVTGFVGRAFCQAAQARGHELLGLTRTPNVPAPDGCRPVYGSVENVPWKEIETFAPDAVLHLAWIATPGVYLQSPDNTVFLAQSQTMLRGLMDRGVKHIAGVGTCIEYAPSVEPASEQHSALAPAFPYSRAKVDLMNWLRSVCNQSAIAWTWFRIFYPYGAGEHPSRLPSHLVLRLRQGQEVVLSTPHSVKDFIHISDLAKALWQGLEARITGPVNLGSGQGSSIGHLAQTIAGLMEIDPALIRTADSPGVDPAPFMVANISKIRTTGWEPSMSLTSGLQKLIAVLSSPPTSSQP